jgi:hypothetical protein
MLEQTGELLVFLFPHIEQSIRALGRLAFDKMVMLSA